jgi:hypothetical protein
MASKQVLSAKSALPMKQKRNIHINECVRRLRNCDPDMKWDERKMFLQDYVVRLYHAGYSEWFRHEVVRQAIARYEGMVKAEQSMDSTLCIVSETGRHQKEDYKKQRRRPVG